MLQPLPNIKCIIGIASGKGGVGNSFVTSNLALALAKIGKKIGLLDACILCPHILKLFGIKTKLVLTEDHKIIPLEKWGVKIISMAGLCSEENEPIAWRGPIISKILQQLLKETLWGELDILLIDFPSDLGDEALTILQNFLADGVIFVTTPQKLAIGATRRVIHGCMELKVPLLGLVENMRGEIFGEGGGSKLAEMTRIPFLGSIPLRKSIVSLCDEGKPPIFTLEEIEIIFRKITRTIIEKIMVA